MQRIWLVVGCLFVAACLVSGSSFAQDNQVVRVGVTVLGGAAGITGAAGRDRLVKALNKQKKSQVEAVPIEGNQRSDLTRGPARRTVFSSCSPPRRKLITKAARQASRDRPPISRSITPPWSTSCTGSRIDGSGKWFRHGTRHRVQGEVVVLQALDNVAKKVSANINNAGTTK